MKMGEVRQGWLPLELWVSLCAAVWLEKLHAESQPTFGRLFSLKIFSMNHMWVTKVVVLRQLNSLFFLDNIQCSNTIFFSFPFFHYTLLFGK